MILKNTNFINSIDEKLFTGYSLYIENEIIKDIKDTNENENCIEISEEVIDLNGYTILPGLINSHCHPGYKQINGISIDDFHLEYLEQLLKEGVTLLRDEGMFTDMPIENYVHRKRQISESNNYPSIVGVGKFFTAKGGYGGVAPIGVNNLIELKENFDKAAEDGIDLVKTVLEDGFDPSTFGLPKLSDELLNELCKIAHINNMKVSAHVTQSHNLERLINAGIDDAAHMVYDYLSDELISKMIEKNISVVPTLTFYKMLQDKFQAPFLDIAKDNLSRFVKAGGLIGVGDDFIEEDLPWYRMGFPRVEIQLLRETGITNFEIIQASTRNGSIICGVDKIVGTIETGKNADLIVIDGNPLDNIEDIFNIKMVIKKGKIVVDNIKNKD